MCEHCQQKWLTIGGFNATQLSLLSTRTTELDTEKVNFRHALINTVRSTASIGAPTALTSVPEASSHRPFKGHSQRPISHGCSNEITPSNNGFEIGIGVDEGNRSLRLPINHEVSNYSGRRESTANARSIRVPSTLLSSLKRKLKDTLPILKRTRMRDFISSMKPVSLVTDGATGQTSTQPPNHKIAGKGSCSGGHNKVTDRVVPGAYDISHK
ncbi:hypothetical protein DM02DRAFT_629179 [Periconia macrospinosa]|uniref:Uncharacterized protein n=1 Tax=Periconia macrospinosa TaxID=97972 RepID=A0A2V1DN58_9PLEO|nr:hypothetical protein DM02DRAFT_629179 [Periconia macrospinosa]